MGHAERNKGRLQDYTPGRPGKRICRVTSPSPALSRDEELQHATEHRYFG